MCDLSLCASKKADPWQRRYLPCHQSTLWLEQWKSLQMTERISQKEFYLYIVTIWETQIYLSQSQVQATLRGGDWLLSVEVSDFFISPGPWDFVNLSLYFPPRIPVMSNIGGNSQHLPYPLDTDPPVTHMSQTHDYNYKLWIIKV